MIHKDICKTECAVSMFQVLVGKIQAENPTNKDYVEEHFRHTNPHCNITQTVHVTTVPAAHLLKMRISIRCHCQPL